MQYLLPDSYGIPLKASTRTFRQNLSVPEGARSLWLNEWHTDLEWLRATHKTEYSNAIVGLNEQLARHRNEAFDFLLKFSGRGFRQFPGPVIKEVLSDREKKTSPVAEGAAIAP